MLTDTDRNFFRPTWRRITATLLCTVWALIEWLSGAPFWGVIATGLTFYCLWNFFYRFDGNLDPKESNAADQKEE